MARCLCLIVCRAILPQLGCLSRVRMIPPLKSRSLEWWAEEIDLTRATSWRFSKLLTIQFSESLWLRLWSTWTIDFIYKQTVCSKLCVCVFFGHKYCWDMKAWIMHNNATNTPKLLYQVNGEMVFVFTLHLFLFSTEPGIYWLPLQLVKYAMPSK